ncbi:carbon-nitrogen hydrolase family protein [Pseudoclavibacter soli]|uniref:carbon-nitrogen hydrolase family protein n=1 Tax=Pseudoclavibacter soli TaxID=452623 RepID=UPI0003F74FEB|nr:carbon-nitrogen hydrolase family protein [Pseudoclavibacter soli]
MGPTALTVAAGQFAPGADKVENLRLITMYVQEAADRGARLIVFPEYASYFSGRLGEDYVNNAEPLDGPFVQALAGLAERYNLTIVAGMLEQVDNERRFSNTIVAVSPQGQIVAEYRKVHLFDAFGHRESQWVVPGPLVDPQIFDIDGLRVGIQTCYDLRFPEVTRRLIDFGAELVVIPAQWVGGPLKEHHWSTLVQARAIENTAYVLAAGQSIPHGIGRSLIVDPMGVVLSAAGAEDAFISARVQPERIAQVREVNPALAARRLEITVPQPGDCSPIAQ